MSILPLPLVLFPLLAHLRNYHSLPFLDLAYHSTQLQSLLHLLNQFQWVIQDPRVQLQLQQLSKTMNTNTRTIAMIHLLLLHHLLPSLPLYPSLQDRKINNSLSLLLRNQAHSQLLQRKLLLDGDQVEKKQKRRRKIVVVVHHQKVTMIVRQMILMCWISC